MPDPTPLDDVEFLARSPHRVEVLQRLREGSWTRPDLHDETGYTFEYRFDDLGIYPYVCEPHRTMGMRGAVVVLAGEPGT